MRRSVWLLAVSLGLIIVALWGFGAYSMYQKDRSTVVWPAPESTTLEWEETSVPTHAPSSPTATSVSTTTPTLVPVETTTPPGETVSPTSTPKPSPPLSPTLSPTQPIVPAEGRFIFVDQDTQLVHIYEDGVKTRSLPCSTGLSGPQMNTPSWEGVVGEYWGTFFAYEVYADEAWYLFKSLGSILIHSSPYTIENGVKVYQDLEILGVRPASHGCIRLSPEDALWFTEWGPEGVPIVITPLEDH